MSISRFYLCAVPAIAWAQQSIEDEYGIYIASFVADALGCEKRIPKGVNLENEYSRYTLCCQRIEQAILLSGKLVFVDRLGKEFLAALKVGKIPTRVLDSSYLSILTRTEDNPGPERLGASFYPPDSVGRHRAAFAEWVEQQEFEEMNVMQQRLAFLRAAEKAHCGIVEVQNCFFTPRADGPALPKSSGDSEERTEGTKPIEIPDFAFDGIAIASFEKDEKARWKITLRNQIRDALETGEPVTFGNQAPHDVITDVLNELVFVPKGQRPHPLELRIAYSDGSEANPFPLFCLKSASSTVSARKKSPPPLRVALMSMRHLELDPEIDFCWFRNRDVSRTRTLAETDRFCYDSTLAQLQDCPTQGSLIIHLYHTGFEPAVLGFYRAVVHTLLRLRAEKSSAKLMIRPFYYRGSRGYEEGLEWR